MQRLSNYSSPFATWLKELNVKAPTLWRGNKMESVLSRTRAMSRIDLNYVQDDFNIPTQKGIRRSIAKREQKKAYKEHQYNSTLRTLLISRKIAQQLCHS